MPLRRRFDDRVVKHLKLACLWGLRKTRTPVDSRTLRFQSEKESLYLEARNVIEAGEEYDMVFNFGENGAHLYLNGEKVDNAPEFKVDLTQNTGSLVIGANTWARTEKNPDWRADYFDGWIDDFIIFDHALSPQEVAGVGDPAPNPGPEADGGSGGVALALKLAQDSLDSYSIL